MLSHGRIGKRIHRDSSEIQRAGGVLEESLEHAVGSGRARDAESELRAGNRIDKVCGLGAGHRGLVLKRRGTADGDAAGFLLLEAEIRYGQKDRVNREGS